MKPFISTRARLVRKSSGDQFYGWVTDGPESRLVLKLDHYDEFMAGEPFEIFLSSVKASSSIESTYVGLVDGHCYFTVPSLVRMDPPLPQARRRSMLPMGTIITDSGESHEVEIVDIAPQGIGIESPISFETGDKVRFAVKTEMGPIEIKTEVVYSRFGQGEDSEKCRVGLQFAALGRIDQARWSQLLAS
ncbi:MAG: PilZ domain-containing protein [Armatimonadetes bacterium]|nr:PilZ domain-containing protein [Armatimonadota bacterium]